MKFKNFIFLTFAMRFISIVGSVWMGVFTDTEMYRALIVLGVIVVIIMILGIIFKNTLVDIIDKAYTKFRG